MTQFEERSESMTATNAQQIVIDAKARVARMLDNLHPDDFTTEGFYARLVSAWESVTFEIISDNQVRATVANSRFQYITGEALDVDTSEEIFVNGHIIDDGPRSMSLILHCDCETCDAERENRRNMLAQ